MSLIHWWPLNGDLKDYGVKHINLVVTNAPSTQYVSGKIGQCYNFNGEAWMQASGVSVGTNCSICCWAKTSSYGAMFWGMQCSASDYMNLYNCGPICLNVGDSADNPFGSVPAVFDGIWHHYVVVFKGSEKAKLYIDGIYRAEAKTYRNPTMNNQNFTIATWNYSSHGYYWNGGINDVRIYDHALSAKEVKEISKGLVLHYDFNDPYVEGTTNLISAVASTNPRLPVAENGVDLQTTSGDAYCGLALSAALVNGSKYTLSFDVSNMGTNDYCSFGFYDNGMHNTTSIYNGRNVITFTAWNTASSLTFDDGGRSNANIIHLRNFQLEQKDHATPYVNGTRAAGKIFDCSGYGYNGYQQGEGIQIISDSACGKYSARFDSNESGTSWISTNGIEPLHNFTNLTYTAWVYQRERTSDRACICIGNCYFTINDGGLLSGYAYGKNPEGYHTGTRVIPLNTWTHIAIVWDDSYIYGYINGVQDFKIATTGTMSYLGVNVGKESGLYRQLKGSIADFKIYSTALSASDILAEYNRKASIDKSGILFTGEFAEGNSTNINVTKTAMVKCNNIVEGASNVKFIGGYTQLEYIESTGTQYIDTGIVINNNYEFILEEMNNFDTNNHYMCGSSGNAKMLGTLNNVLWSNGILYSNVTFNRNTKEKIGFKVVTDGSTSSDYLMRNYTTNTKHSGRSSFIPTGSGTVKVFSHNGSTKEIFKCYDFKLFKDDMLVSHLIPVKRNSDNVLGMYDLVNKTFLTNAGSGTFTAGPEIGKINAIYANEIKEI